MNRDNLFPNLPKLLVEELLSEFQEIQSSYYEGKWRASGLNAGRFCEVSFSIISNIASQKFPDKASKPKDFIGSCKKLESDNSIPHGLRMIASRTLTTLYEVRNNRDISHTGAAVNPSFMDASLALANSKWILAELVREFHGISESEAQTIVDNLSQYAPPIIWTDDNIRRVLRNDLTFDEKVLLLLASTGGEALADELFTWIDSGTKKYLNSRLKKLHSDRMVETKAYGEKIKLLPPGNFRVAQITQKLSLAEVSS